VKLSIIVTPVKDVKLPENAAQRLLDELTSRAKAAVDGAALRQERAHDERRAAVEKELAAAQERLAKIQSQLREARSAQGVGSVGPDRDSGGRAIAAEMQQIEVNLAATRARLKVIEDDIAKLGGKPAAEAQRPDLKALWTELIAAREAAVQAARNTPDSPESRLMIAQAEAELAEAKIRAATSSDAIRPGFDSPDRWQGERITLRATIAEQEARLGALSERLAVAKQKEKPAATQQPTAFDVDRLQQDEQRARQEVGELTQQLDQLRRERRGVGMAPKLLVLDGRAEPAKE
jgi:hypothetical protein